MGTRVRRIGQAVAGASALGLTVIAVLAAAGCSKGPEPSALETPNVVWPDGPPTGPYEDTEWVKAFRARELTEAVAWNAMDFSDITLVEAIGLEEASSLAQSRVEWRQKFKATGDEGAATNEVQTGPDGAVALDVIEDGAGGALVVMCVDARLVESGQQVRSWSVTPRTESGFHVRHLGRDEVTGGKSLEEYQAECEAATIPQGFFDPAPEPNLDPDAKVIGPADASKYDLD